jgi:hypothetical protein
MLATEERKESIDDAKPLEDEIASFQIHGDLMALPFELRHAYNVLRMLDAIEWRHLPYAGGLLDQPEQLMTNIFTIMKWRHIYQAQAAANEMEAHLGASR